MLRLLGINKQKETLTDAKSGNAIRSRMQSTLILNCADRVMES